MVGSSEPRTVPDGDSGEMVQIYIVWSCLLFMPTQDCSMPTRYQHQLINRGACNSAWVYVGWHPFVRHFVVAPRGGKWDAEGPKVLYDTDVQYNEEAINLKIRCLYFSRSCENSQEKNYPFILYYHQNRHILYGLIILLYYIVLFITLLIIKSR